MIRIRQAVLADSDGMCRVHDEIHAAGKRLYPGDKDLIQSRYFDPERSIVCSVAIDDADRIIGFQSIVRSQANNSDGTPEGWGIIGTHISPTAARQGAGARLFEVSLAAACREELPCIEALIALHNIEGQAYYESMGFRTYRVLDDSIGKRLDLGRLN